MKGYQVRFLLETMAVLFEKKRDIITLLDDISTRMEELEVELEHMMIDAGFDINNDRFKRGWWDSNAYDSTFKTDFISALDDQRSDESYRMD